MLVEKGKSICMYMSKMFLLGKGNSISIFWFTQTPGKGVSVTALVFTGDVEDKLQRLQWILGLSPWRPFCFSVNLDNRPSSGVQCKKLSRDVICEISALRRIRFFLPSLRYLNLYMTNYLTYISMMTSSNGNIFRVTGLLLSPVNSPHKGQWRGALMFSLICAWINGWVNNRETPIMTSL